MTWVVLSDVFSQVSLAISNSLGQLLLTLEYLYT